MPAEPLSVLALPKIEALVRQKHAFLKNIFQSSRLLALLLFTCAPLSSAFADDWHFPGIERVVAVSDIHGAYEGLVATLQAASVIDDELSWSGGGTHLVITGDLIDRGPGSRRVMEIIMRLEREAASAGGQVHLTLGNHEVMNIIGDIRYVTDIEYAEFADVESAQERELWYQRYRASQPENIDESTARASFNKKAPPGFFGHRRAYRHDGIYGKWLLEKPLMIIINDTAFVHGGLPTYVAENGLQGVNENLKMDLRNYAHSMSALQDAGVLSPIMRFVEQPKLLSAKFENGELDEDLVAAAKDVVNLRNSILHSPNGPLWYRGSSTCSALIESDVLSAALDKIGATRVAIGHTTTESRQVQQRIDGRVIEINTGILQSEYEGSGYALVIEDGKLTVVGEDGATGLSPIVPPRRVGYESETIDDDALEILLANGNIVETATQKTDQHLVRVEADGMSVMASFSELPRDKGFVPELAAYRLDRMLGLDMVPATVRREVDGQQGTLQFAPQGTLNERQRADTGKGRAAACSLLKQWDAMYVFDVLVHSTARMPQTLLYNPESWQLILIDHESSFSRNKGRPTHLKGVELSIGERWRSVLLGLDDERLSATLGDVLDKRRLAALAARRDALIEDSVP